MRRRFDGIWFYRIRDSCPEGIKETIEPLIKIGDKIKWEVRWAEKKPLEGGRTSALHLRPLVDEYVLNFLSLIRLSAEKEKVKKSAYQKIEIELKEYLAAMDRIEQDELLGGKVTEGALQVYLNKIEALVTIIYNAIAEAARLETDSKKYWLAVWWAFERRLGLFAKRPLPPEANIDYERLLEAVEKIKEKGAFGDEI